MSAKVDIWKELLAKPYPTQTEAVAALGQFNSNTVATQYQSYRAYREAAGMH